MARYAAPSRPRARTPPTSARECLFIVPLYVRMPSDALTVRAQRKPPCGRRQREIQMCQNPAPWILSGILWMASVWQSAFQRRLENQICHGRKKMSQPQHDIGTSVAPAQTLTLDTVMGALPELEQQRAACHRHRRSSGSRDRGGVSRRSAVREGLRGEAGGGGPSASTRTRCFNWRRCRSPSRRPWWRRSSATARSHGIRASPTSIRNFSWPSRIRPRT